MRKIFCWVGFLVHTKSYNTCTNTYQLIDSCPGIKYKYIYTFILERSAGSIPIRAPSAPQSRFSAISPPLGLVSSRGVRPAIALSREGLIRVRVRPRRGRRAVLARWQGRVSAVSHTRPNHSPVSLQRPVCWVPPTVPRSRSFFFGLKVWFSTVMV